MIYHVSPQGWPYCKYTERKQIASSIYKNITFYHLLFSSRDNAYKWMDLNLYKKILLCIWDGNTSVPILTVIWTKNFFDIGQIKDWYMMLIQAILYLVFLSEIDPRWPIEGGCDLSSQASQHLAIHLRLRYMKKPSITNYVSWYEPSGYISLPKIHEKAINNKFVPWY